MLARAELAAAPMGEFAPASIWKRLGVKGEATIEDICRSCAGVEKEELLLQLALHLPRLPVREIRDTACVVAEAERLAKRLHALRKEYLDFIPKPAPDNPLLNYQCDFLAESVAQPILERFHYLLSFRPGGIYLGLSDRTKDSWPLAILSLSRFDLQNMYHGLPENVKPESVLVVSRVYAFNSTLSNSISFFMSRARELLRRTQPQITLLLTYLNPNVGFTGASYKADNWVVFGEESGTRYLYLDGDYKTDRFFWERFGSSDLVELKKVLGNRVSQSRFWLRPLQVFARSISRVTLTPTEKKFEHWTPVRK
jgi:hypothetical protein